jgi:hypothetical protein
MKNTHTHTLHIKTHTHKNTHTYTYIHTLYYAYLTKDFRKKKNRIHLNTYNKHI